MREFRFILGRRALIVFLALLVATGAFLGVPAATLTLAESPPGSQEVPRPWPIHLRWRGRSLILPVIQRSCREKAAPAPGLLCPPLLNPLPPRPHAGATPWPPPPRGAPSVDGTAAIATTPGFSTPPLTPGACSTPAPPPRPRATITPWPPPSGVLLFGGWDGSYRPDTWLFNTGTGTWTLVPTTNGSPSSPSARSYHAMAGSARRGCAPLGGSDGRNRNDTWIFNTATNTWGQLTDTTPPRGALHPRHGRHPSGALLFGG